MTLRDLDSLRACLFLVLATGAHAQTYRLSQEAPSFPGSSVLDGFEISSDSRRVVYHGVINPEGGHELYSTRLDGFLLPNSLSGGLSATSFAVSADGATVVFQVGTSNLWAAPLSAGIVEPVLLHDGASVERYVITPDSSHVVFQTSQSGFLYSRRLDGAGPLNEIADAIMGHLGLHNFQALGNSQGVLYRVPGTGDLVREPLEGGTVLQLSSPDHPTGSETFTQSPDGSTAVYLAGGLGNRRLYAVPTDGSQSPTTLTPDAMGISRQDYVVSPDGQRVIYGLGTPGNVASLVSVPIDGSSLPVQLNVAPAPSQIRRFLFAPDASRVVFVAGTGSIDTFVAPIDGSQPPVALGADPDLASIEVSGNGAFVVYLTRAQPRQLYSVPLDAGSPPVRLCTSLAEGNSGVNGFAVSPDGTLVAYSSDAGLFFVPTAGGASSGVHGESSSLPRFSDDGSRVVFRSVDYVRTVPVDGTYGAGFISQALPAFGNQDFVLTTTIGYPVDPTDRFAVFVTSESAQHPTTRYITTLDGEGTPVEVPLPFRAAHFSPDGEWLVLSHFTEDLLWELYSIRSEDALAGDPLGAPLVTGFTSDPLISPDSRFVLFRKQDVLQTVPIDGSGFPSVIGGAYSGATFAQDRVVFFNGSGGLESAPFAGGPSTSVVDGPVRFGWTIHPAETHVAYQKEDTGGVVQTFVAPLDGGSPPVEVACDLTAAELEFSAGGDHLIFAATSSSLSEGVYCVPTDGSEAPVLVHPPLQPGEALVRHEASDNGASVVVLVDTLGDKELYATPLDGSGPPRLLAMGVIVNFRVASDASWVVYRVFGHPSTLRSVPLDGSQAFQVLVTDVEDSNYFLTSSGLVVYSQGDVYGVPIDGSNPPKRIDAAGGSTTFRFASPQESRLVYTSDHESVGVRQLYAAYLSPEIEGIGPVWGSFEGGNTVTLRGGGFDEGMTVTFGGIPSPSVTFVNRSEVRAVVPAHDPGQVSVTGSGGKLVSVRQSTVRVDVAVDDGLHVDTLAGGYLYSAVRDR